VAVLSASLLVVVMDLTILNIAIPDLSADLRPSANELLWIVDGYPLVLAGLLVTVSAIADRWGRRRMLITGYVVVAGASLAVFLADSPTAVIAIRCLLGAGGAMIMPTTLSLMRAVFTDPAERARALGIWASVAGVGAAIGPLLGGFLLEHFSWRAALLVNVPLMLIAAVAALLVLPESRSARPGRWDPVAATLSLVGMVALVWAVKEFARQQHLSVPGAWVALAVGIMALVAFTRRCLRAREPFLDLRLFRRPQFSAGVIAALGAMTALAAAMLLVAQWLQLVRGFSPIGAGVALMPTAIASAAASMVAPWLATTWRARPILAGAVALTGAGMLLFELWPGGLTLPAVLVSLTMVGAGTGALALGSAMIMASTPIDRAGNAAAIEEVAYDLGNVMGVAVLGSIAGIVYRAGVDRSGVLQGLSTEDADTARDSLGGALEIAEEGALTELAETASREFGRGLEVTGLIGGLALMAVAVLVHRLTPRDLDVTRQLH